MINMHEILGHAFHKRICALLCLGAATLLFVLSPAAKAFPSYHHPSLQSSVDSPQQSTRRQVIASEGTESREDDQWVQQPPFAELSISELSSLRAPGRETCSGQCERFTPSHTGSRFALIHSTLSPPSVL